MLYTKLIAKRFLNTFYFHNNEVNLFINRHQR